MTFAPFYQLFPEIAAEETKSITFFGDNGEEDIYYLADAYCTDPECDCRRVFFYVLQEGSPNPLTVVTWGWESRAFYRRWFPSADDEMLNDLVGPSFNYGSPRFLGDERIFDAVKSLVKTIGYKSRIKRHYALYKEKLKTVSFPSVPLRIEKTGRNELCHCGSGKKYKKCCLGK